MVKHKYSQLDWFWSQSRCMLFFRGQNHILGSPWLLVPVTYGDRRTWTCIHAWTWNDSSLCTQTRESSVSSCSLIENDLLDCDYIAYISCNTLYISWVKQMKRHHCPDLCFLIISCKILKLFFFQTILTPFFLRFILRLLCALQVCSFFFCFFFNHTVEHSQVLLVGFGANKLVFLPVRQQQAQ